MKKLIGFMLALLVLAIGFVVVRHFAPEEPLDIEITFHPPGEVSPGTVINGREIVSVTEGWQLRFNDRTAKDGPLTVGLSDFVDAGKVGARGLPPPDAETAEFLCEVFGFEGRMRTDLANAWSLEPNTNGWVWIRRVHFLHTGDLLDPMVVVLVRDPADDHVHVGILRVAREHPEDVTGRVGGCDAPEPDWLEGVRNTAPERRLRLEYWLDSSRFFLEQAGLEGTPLLEKAGAKGWWLPR